MTREIQTIANIGSGTMGHATAHCDHDDHDHFHAVHPDTDWRSAIAHGVKIGLGNEQYELITVK